MFTRPFLEIRTLKTFYCPGVEAVLDQFFDHSGHRSDVAY